MIAGTKHRETPYRVIDLGQHWIRQWLDVCLTATLYLQQGRYFVIKKNKQVKFYKKKSNFIEENALINIVC